jgi:hypothetical protein
MDYVRPYYSIFRENSNRNHRIVRRRRYAEPLDVLIRFRIQKDAIYDRQADEDSGARAPHFN